MIHMSRKTAVTSIFVFCAVALIAAPAFAQGVAFQASSLPQQARFEGVTETMGAVVLQATGTGTVPSGSSITVVYSGTITNTSSLANLSGSFAGATCAGAGCTGNAANNFTPGGGVAPGFGVAASGNQLTIQFTGTQGATLAATSQMGFHTGDYILVSQVRVNVNALGSSVGTVSAQMSGTSSFSSSNPITFTNANVPVASVIPALTAKIGSAGNIQTCNIAAANTFTVKVTENYPAAITSVTDETGFTPTVAPAPSVAMQIIVTISGVPSGMSVGWNAFGAGASTESGTLLLAETGAVQTSTGGNLVFSFNSTGDSTSAVETATLQFNIGVLNSSSAFASGSLPSIGTVVTPTATVSLGPIPSTSLPITPLGFATNTEAASPGTIATIGDCVTNLLFPFITNQVGFDTSIQIANTTSDKLAFTSGNASQQNGTCTLTFYPTDLTTQTATATGTIGSPTQATSPTIPSGGVYSFQQSGSAFKNQSGYLFAVCRFVDGHGFSWVGNASPALGTSASTISQGLLALVIPQYEIGNSRLLQTASCAPVQSCTVTQSCTGVGCAGTSTCVGTSTCTVSAIGTPSTYEALSH